MSERVLSLSSKRSARLWLGLVILAWGMQAIVTQSLLLREALVLLFGSELAWGIVLFAWLFGVGVGATVSGWLVTRLRRADVALVIVLLLLSLAACFDVWVFRGARAWLGVGPGELLPIPTTALAAMLFVSPASALVGLAFPLACRVRHDCDGRTTTGVGPLGSVYALESAGSLIGGAGFSFWAVEHLSPIETALYCGTISVAASALLLRVTTGKRLGAFCLAVIAGFGFGLAALGGDVLNRYLVDRRWQTIAPGYTLCANMESRYQNLAVGRRAEQFTLYCDGQVSANFPDPYNDVPLAHFWMCEHPEPRRVLVLGGGAEGLLAEILRHPVEQIDYVETDPWKIELLAPFLTERDRFALSDQRVTVHHVDARYFVKTRGALPQEDRFDLVIARLAEPTSALSARYYTDAFYDELRHVMTPSSVLCMTVDATPTSLTPESARYLASIRATLRPHFPSITIGWGNPAQLLAATAPGLVSTDPAELTRRYTERGIHSEIFHPLWFQGATDWLDAKKVEQRAAELDAATEVEISTDLRPIAYVHRLIVWERMTGEPSGQVIARLRSIGWWKLVTGVVIVAVTTLIACRFRYRSPSGWSAGAVILSVGTTGFVTMALSIVWLFAFQNLYGHVYQRIGWIIAVFMAGLVVGCGFVSLRTRRIAQSETLRQYLWRRMITVDVLLAGLALTAPAILQMLGAAQTTRVTFALVEVAISVLVALTGLLGGATFALAGGLQFGLNRDAGAAAGTVVGADHVGACLGALLTGVLLVPIFGTAAATLFLGTMKIGTAVALWVGRRFT